MANEFKIKTGLILNNTQPVYGITDNFNADSSTLLATVHATKQFIDGSLYLRDISINNLTKWEISQDASIAKLQARDASLDASLNILFIENDTQDASILKMQYQSYDSDYKLLKAFPLSFIRDTAKVNIPMEWSEHPDASRNKYLVTTAGADYVIINRSVPVEVTDMLLEPINASTHWMIATQENNCAFITNIDISSNKIHWRTAGQGNSFPEGTALEFYSWNKNQTVLNGNFDSGWSPWTTDSSSKTCIHLWKEDASLYGIFYGGPNENLAVVSTIDNFATKNIEKIVKLSDFNSQGYNFTTTQRSGIYNLTEISDGIYAGLIQTYTNISDASTFNIYPLLTDLHFTKTKLIGSSMKIVDGYDSSTLIRTPCLFKWNNQLKIVAVIQYEYVFGGASVMGTNWKVILGDFDLETCSITNRSVIATAGPVPTTDASLNYIGGEIDVVYPWIYDNQLYIVVGGTQIGTPTSLNGGNRNWGFLLNKKGKWVFDPNGPTIQTPRCETAGGRAYGANTHQGSYPLMYIDKTTNKLLMCHTHNSDSRYYTALVEFDLSMIEESSTSNYDSSIASLLAWQLSQDASIAKLQARDASLDASINSAFSSYDSLYKLKDVSIVTTEASIYDVLEMGVNGKWFPNQKEWFTKVATDASTIQPVDWTLDVQLNSIEIEKDAGAVTIVDMVVSTVPTVGTEESYCFGIDEQCIFKAYAESTGTGGITNKNFVVEATYQCLGDPNTNGSWRFSVVTGDLVFEKRIAGVWTVCGRLTE